MSKDSLEEVREEVRTDFNKHPSNPAKDNSKDETHLAPFFVNKGEMADKAMKSLFDEAYGDILFDLFWTWCQTDINDVEKRERLFTHVLGMGAVKSKLNQYSMHGRNVAMMARENYIIEEDE